MDRHLIFMDRCVLFIERNVLFMNRLLIFMDRCLIVMDRCVLFKEKHVLFMDRCLILMDRCVLVCTFWSWGIIIDEMFWIHSMIWHLPVLLTCLYVDLGVHRLSVPVHSSYRAWSCRQSSLGSYTACSSSSMPIRSDMFFRTPMVPDTRSSCSSCFSAIS